MLPQVMQRLLKSFWSGYMFGDDTFLVQSRYKIYCGLKMCYLAVSATEQLATTQQGKMITTEVYIQARNTTMAYLQR